MSSPLSAARRAFLGQFSALGVGSTLLPGILWAQASQGQEITAAGIAAAAELAGLSFTDEEREQMLAAVRRQSAQIRALHQVPLANSTAPALHFNPLPRPEALPSGPQRPIVVSRRAERRAPAVLEDLAFEPVTVLAELLRRRAVTSVQLTQMYLGRLKRLDSQLLCVTTLLEDRAMAQARAADAEIARGNYRGPLHGIPWGAKDLLAVRGAPTTWGTPPFREQQFAEDATVVQRLDAAGAVLIAKLTLGELAMGDRWYGGMTRNPWKLDQGSSGSSAGSASATAAGCVGFAIGSETLGSISSPSTRCGATGLRPTFGRVPRTGAMALSWSMDKLGPITRSVEDCALVLAAIHGPDGRDLTTHAAPFNWDGNAGIRGLRVAFVKSAFDASAARGGIGAFDTAALEALRGLGVELVPVEVPEAAYDAMRIILDCEAAAAFDEFTRSGKVHEMAQQTPNAWPTLFRRAHLIPAADYINANRVRTLAMQDWDRLMRDIDVIVAPTSSSQLLATNLTGHPAVILPHGFRETDGTPVSITFLGKLFGEEAMLRVAQAYQQASGHHLKHPSLT
ncbi:MAG: amidase [Gemmatimonadaceae bacterium]|nr:amidase [Gemmatimonadaceae bacterium]